LEDLPTEINRQGTIAKNYAQRTWQA
jgi:hypothetical protein